MSYLLKTIRSVEKIYSELDVQSRTFQDKSGLSCLSNCTHCCTNNKIQASVLEFLPLAMNLYHLNIHDQLLDEIEKGSEQCICLSPLTVNKEKFGCRFYDQRGLICRLFGYSSVPDKQGNLSLYTCKFIKETQQNKLENIIRQNGSLYSIPSAEMYQRRLMSIDPVLANDYNPINQSIYKAIMKVAYLFSNKPTKIGRYKKTG